MLGFHALPRNDSAAGPWAGFWMGGYAGVTLFFVLSGFVLVYTYGPLSGAGISTRDFLAARVARLYPMYLAALLVGVPEFLRWVVTGAPGPHRPDAISVGVVAFVTPLMLQAWVPRIGCSWNCPGWSLSAEAFFYLLFPLLAPLLHGRSARVLTCFALGAWIFALGATGLRAAPPETWRDHELLAALIASPYTPLLRLPEFLLGVVLGRWYLDRRLRGEALRPDVGLGVAVLALALIVLFAASYQPARDDPWLNLWLLPLFGALILGLAERGNRGLLARPAAMLLGEASYAFYLIHGPLHGYALAIARRVSTASPTEHPWVIFFAYLGTVLSLAVLFYRCLEHPARLALRRRFARGGAPA